MSRSLLKRILLCLSGLCIMGTGLALLTNAGLGTSPISALPYVLSIIFDFSMGMGMFLMNAVLFLVQMLLLGKLVTKKLFLQIPCLFVFCLIVDVVMYLSAPFIPSSWPVQMLMNVAGTCLLGFGVFLTLVANVALGPVDGFVLALAYRTRLSFGNLKIINDVTLVSMAILLSLLCLGSLSGLREGTIAASVLTGMSIRWFMANTRPSIEAWISR